MRPAVSTPARGAVVPVLHRRRSFGAAYPHGLWLTGKPTGKLAAVGASPVVVAVVVVVVVVVVVAPAPLARARLRLHALMHVPIVEGTEFGVDLHTIEPIPVGIFVRISAKIEESLVAATRRSGRLG